MMWKLAQVKVMLSLKRIGLINNADRIQAEYNQKNQLLHTLEVCTFLNLIHYIKGLCDIH